MCGICGFVDYSNGSSREVLAGMVESLHHRGPDDNGYEIEATGDALIGFGQTRLAILDITQAGHQPMHYNDLTILLNGEVYNFKEIRADLTRLGHSFVSESDTEVVVHAFSEWGTLCVKRFIGMFVIVIFDKKRSEITVFRDRTGVKPFYYYWNNGLFMFASELKAFHRHPGFIRELNLDTVPLYLEFGYIPAPYCIFQNCNKLLPGHLLTFNIKTSYQQVIKYWDVNDFYLQPDIEISYQEAKSEAEILLHSAFEYRMVSDVPVGVFLSSGYDSTAVTAILQSHRTTRLKTFTIGFEEGNNEAPHARKIADYLGTDHTEYYCRTSEAKEIIPFLPVFFDEPFADSSAIPTILVSRLARKHVTVALSADAGDETFAGYVNYGTFLKNMRFVNKIPPRFRGLTARFAEIGESLTPDNKLNHKLSTLSKLLKCTDEQLPKVLLRSYFTLNKRQEESILLTKQKSRLDTVYEDNNVVLKDALSVALATDYLQYLPDDILTKVDRSTMSVSLEGREPFLDHRIIEFAARLPNRFKYGSTPKMILKDIVHDYIPKPLMDRPKSGFSVPVISWLRGDLSYLLDEYLSPAKINESGIFSPDYLRKMIGKFMHGHLYDPFIIWKLLQFQMWYMMWLK